MKKTLIIHPQDRSTDFLKPIYDGVSYKTVITGDVDLDTVHKEIEHHSRVIMMGHGSPGGLFSCGRFMRTKGGYVISERTIPFLKGKECIFIWCHADKFVLRHDLKGFYSGMFISEVGEATYCGLPKTPQKVVTESNERFARIVGNMVNRDLKNIYKEVVDIYGNVASNNPVAKYNHERLYYR